MELPISYEERGKKIGEKVGRIEERKRIARNMLQKGLDIHLITETTTLSTKEVLAIKQALE